ncbi:hypothetical protein WHR41_06418 [Cladosporium halotolerans]|uniref:UBC core domain-containing protein n=1 Tax=Cladosporium halotolerans TaxID=1052096 RepID=A0AB34KJW0_9PEZI
MPRRQFVADLQKAQDGPKPSGINSIRAGDDDGQFEFDFTAAALGDAQGATISITAMIPDVSEYPNDHQYMIFCGEEAPLQFAQALQNLRDTNRKTVFELTELVSARLLSLAVDSDGDSPMEDSMSDEGQSDLEDFDEDEVYDDDDDAFDFKEGPNVVSNAHISAKHEFDGNSRSKAFRDRIRLDLLTAKDEGFKVGHLGLLLDGYCSFVTISIRMSKLGISEEAMQAWQVDPSDYLVLLIHYPNGYKTDEQLQAYDGSRVKSNIGMRVVAGKKYKPTLKEATRMFSKTRKYSDASSDSKEENIEPRSMREIFISRPLAALLESILIPILRFRKAGMDWTGAEAYYEFAQGVGSLDDQVAIPESYYKPEELHKALPNIVQADHHREHNSSKYSFPLLAMQFTLRHFVRCTEFCMICHAKLDSDLEAIKPYVCDRPLCLFQYMSLGLGPSIEHEIMSQPYVVDLLVSFCYSSAKAYKLKDFPDGLALMVPPVNPDDVTPPVGVRSRFNRPEAYIERPPTGESFDVGFDPERREIEFFNKPKGGCPVSRGQWIVISNGPSDPDDKDFEIHCRVSETTFYPTISLDELVTVSVNPSRNVKESHMTQNPMQGTDEPRTQSLTPRWTAATCSPYSQEFSELKHHSKCQAMCKLLDTLPSVKEMQDYLSTHHESDLKGWVSRVSPSAASLLRWIIASNRACIMQCDTKVDDTNEKSKGPTAERLHGMDGYMQFRFAMGAPDKESRFMSEVRTTTDRLSLRFPTIFAWHGSPLHNWHMIIREGLHFKNVDHGRAYGNGVYHAKDAHTSSGYALMMMTPAVWPNSVLRISSALALNEIVNAPAEFVSKDPFYVVSQLDWIRTRYLFVKCAPTDESIKPGKEERPENFHPQDPSQTPRGSTGAIVIPASAIKSGRAQKVTDAAEQKTKNKGGKKVKPSKGAKGSSETNAIDLDNDTESVTSKSGKRSSSGTNSPSKKQKNGRGTAVATAIDADEDADSDQTDTEDLNILLPEPDPAENKPAKSFDTQLLTLNRKLDSKVDTGPTTDFEPGTLDFSTLPLMPEPTYATSATTKRLMIEIQSLTKVQSSTDPASLGWHIDFAKIENVYQWIVELHSFHTFSVDDKPIPLVADMKKAGTASVVLEVRFGPDFPYSPPYIRVIRPRFLPFLQGGGGHVVIGGAMCMELLTNSGWQPIMSMESVLMQVRMAIASEPFARLEGKGSAARADWARRDYGAVEAAEGYVRACASHGWKVPPGFREVAYGMAPTADGAASDGLGK